MSDKVQNDPTWLYKNGEGKICRGAEIVTAKANGWKDSHVEAEAPKKRGPKPKVKASE